MKIPRRSVQLAARSFINFYDLFQKCRTGSKGTTTHVEQDLLRAMLIFSCAGLDAVLKQLINDNLEDIINLDEGAEKQLQKFIEKKIYKPNSGEDNKNILNANWVSTLFSNKNPRLKIIKDLQYSLTSDSLQSIDQVIKIASYFAIEKNNIVSNDNEVKKVFKVRNEIVHEMDSIVGGKKKRNQRNQSEMIKHTEVIFSVSLKFIEYINLKLINQNLS
jgi:RiboL-PSP-HEPN